MVSLTAYGGIRRRIRKHTQSVGENPQPAASCPVRGNSGGGHTRVVVVVQGALQFGFVICTRCRSKATKLRFCVLLRQSQRSIAIGAQPHLSGHSFVRLLSPVHATNVRTRQRTRYCESRQGAPRNRRRSVGCEWSEGGGRGWGYDAHARIFERVRRHKVLHASVARVTNWYSVPCISISHSSLCLVCALAGLPKHRTPVVCLSWTSFCPQRTHLRHRKSSL